VAAAGGPRDHCSAWMRAAVLSQRGRYTAAIDVALAKAAAAAAAAASKQPQQSCGAA